MTGNTPELPKDISNPNKIEQMLPVGGTDQPREGSNSFKAMMQGPEGTQKGNMVNSPFDLARTSGAAAPMGAAGPTLDSVRAQAVHAQTTLGDLQNMLSTPNLKVKPSTKYLLRNKLSDATQQLHSVNAKVGGEPINEEALATPPGAGPIQTFLSYVNSGQASMLAAQNKIQSLTKNGNSMNPAELLLVQIKMNKAQQLLDYSSVLLSKAVEDMKMMFNVQL